MDHLPLRRNDACRILASRTWPGTTSLGYFDRHHRRDPSGSRPLLQGTATASGA
ncbi:hypothetical protein BGW80DRAFT_1315591 [Lactifluus volemus]|nr:hypothetical protein BGW80DRAFT_1315591 [Lactifluus volemus]